MKNIIFALTALWIFSACQKDNFIDTGLHNDKFEGSMMDYLKSDSYNWDSTVLVIQHAGLTDLFEGKDETNPKITFYGPTNLSILRFMFQRGYSKVTDIPKDECKQLILKHIMPGEIKRDDLPVGKFWPPEGGDEFEMMAGNKVWMCKRTEPLGGLELEGGPTYMYMLTPNYGFMEIQIASTNILTNTGVVHSLSYGYVFGMI